MQHEHEVDLFVLGAGSGGLASAKRAALHGARVAVSENDRVGGTCVIRGCVPKKLMVYASALGASRRLATDYGWAAAPDAFSWPALCTGRDAAIARLESMHTQHLTDAGIQLVRGRAELRDAHTVQVGGQTFRAKHILIATGGRPVLPDFEGGGCCITSDGFFELERMPHSAVLIGGGYIAVEFASLLQGLGCAVTMLVRSKVLRTFDHDIGRAMVDSLTRRGVVVHEDVKIERVDQGAYESPDNGPAVTTVVRKGRDTFTVHTDGCIVFAVGRTPNTADLGLKRAGVAMDAEGAVRVDAQHATSLPHIFAVGDVTNRVNLTPVAIRAGRNVADRLFGGIDVPMSYDNVPTAVFADPPAASVGLSEQEARERLGNAVKTFTTRFVPLLYALSPAAHKEKTLMKLVVDKTTDRVLGCHMLGPDAPEIIQGLAIAVQAGLTKAQFDATGALHPSQAEEFVLMR